MSMSNSFIAAPLLLMWLVIAGISIYTLILFIKLAHRGIKALDIYISKNGGGNGPGLL